jgi:hypothetical protein
MPGAGCVNSACRDATRSKHAAKIWHNAERCGCAFRVKRSRGIYELRSDDFCDDGIWRKLVLMPKQKQANKLSEELQDFVDTFPRPLS